MPLISSLEIQNFKCFRNKEKFVFSKGNFFVGANNAGKTAVLKAIDCFFNDSSYDSTLINTQELANRKSGYNKSIISITFDISKIKAASRIKKLKKFMIHDKIEITKVFTYKTVSKNVEIEYRINNGSFTVFEMLDKDIKDILEGIHVSYIHPQEGDVLFKKAQHKIKNKLFNNYGRHYSITAKFKELQEQWEEIRSVANQSISNILTQVVRDVWENATIKVDLPDKIEEIVGISDLTFRSSDNSPEISLTSQGTGVQSSILFHTHYLLDSDKTLHNKGFYYPIWLLEEPESFLHGDIAIKLGRNLTSEDWLNSIQMFISTHSPIILAASHSSSYMNQWIVLDEGKVTLNKLVENINDDDILNTGNLMGDPNFESYFNSFKRDDLVFIEDSKEITATKFIESEIHVSKGLNGTTDVVKYIKLFESMPHLIQKKAFFILDNDKGIEDANLKKYIKDENIIVRKNSFCKYQIMDKVFIILLPENYASENLFDEYEDHLDDIFCTIYEENLTIRELTPSSLGNTVAKMRKRIIHNKNDILNEIKNQQEVKDLFWKKVSERNFKYSVSHVEAIKYLIS